MDLFCQFSGEDYKIISAEGMEPDLAIRFGFIGILVLAIFILSFYSSTHFVSHLLNESHMAAMPVGVVWGLMIVVIYQLLLFTITPAILIGRERSIKGQPMPVTTEKKGLARLSLIFRIAFVVLIAVVVAQPWLVTLFDTSEALEHYRQRYRSEFIVQADSSLIGMESAVEIQLRVDETLYAHPIDHREKLITDKIDTDLRFISEAMLLEREMAAKKNTHLEDTMEARLAGMVAREEESDSIFLKQYSLFSSARQEMDVVKQAGEALADLVDKKLKSGRRLDALLSSNNFYTRKVQLVNSGHPLAWVVTLLVIFVFVLPVALKYHIRNRTSFYTEKKKFEKREVLTAYQQFKKEYATIFREKYGIGIDFYESCTDPPFNTKKKEMETSYPDEKALLTAIYPEGDASDSNKYLVSENII